MRHDPFSDPFLDSLQQIQPMMKDNLDQFFVSPEKPEPGLTATSASFLAGLASQEVNRLESVVTASTFYDTHVELLSGNSEPRLVQKGKDKGFLDKLSSVALRIGELRGFMAYVHEAVKERDRRIQYLETLSFDGWLKLPENKERLEANLNFAHCLRPVFFKGQYPLSYAMVGVIPKNGRKGPLPRAQHPVWADSNSAMAIR